MYSVTINDTTRDMGACIYHSYCYWLHTVAVEHTAITRRMNEQMLYNTCNDDNRNA